jgi:hypothetical protein
VELDADAYEQTAGNYDLSPWRGKMRAFHTSFQDYARTFTQPENEEGALALWRYRDVIRLGVTTTG